MIAYRRGAEAMSLRDGAFIFRHSVAYLVQDCANTVTGQLERKEMGTAFFVKVRLTKGLIDAYLVTARHNLEYARSNNQPLFCRHNLKDGTTETFEVGFDEDYWRVHPTSDVAVMRVEFNRGDEAVLAIPAVNLVTNDRLEKRPLREGTEVCFISLFAPAPGKKQIQPLLRMGHIALLPHEPITVEVGPQKTRNNMSVYLVECFPWGGCSGAPVIVDYPDVTRTSADPLEGAPFGLLGLISSHFDLPRRVGQDVGELTIPNHSGIAAVIPAQDIWDVLMTDDWVELRRNRIAELESQPSI